MILTIRNGVLNFTIPIISMALQFFWCISSAFWMLWICSPHVSMTIKAERNTVFKCVLSTKSFLLNVMKFNFCSAKFVAYTTATIARNKCSVCNISGETHIGLNSFLSAL